jgi:endonuclease/exonuclease/phosphatase family metal-dependent hydrolase
LLPTEGLVRKSVVFFLVVAALAAGGWFFFQNFRIEGVQGLRLIRRESAATLDPLGSAPPVQRSGDAIRIATFNIQVFGTSKASKPHVMDVLARIVRRFDVVAIQEIRSKDEGLLPQFVELVNADGRQYDYVIGPRLGRSSSKEQYAFVFDRASVEIDRHQLYTVADPDDRLHREPLVGWFRVRGPPEDQAFTFSLVNIHTDPDETVQELDALGEVFRAVRDDGRGEDDVIVLGDLNVDDQHLGLLGQIPGITWVISGVPTNTRGTAQYDNIVFHQQATAEFNGRAGVFDILREFNLTSEEALEVSDHLPVWAEFSVYEGGQLGRVATRPEPSQN